MSKFHIDVNGNPAPCSAGVRACPRGGEESHGSTPEEVKAKFESTMASQKFVALKKSNVPDSNTVVQEIKNSKDWYVKYTPKQLNAIYKNARADADLIDSTAPKNEKGNLANRSDLIERDTLNAAAVEAKLAAEINQPREKFGVTVPAGYDTFAAVYDLDGNFIKVAQSTSFSARTFTDKNGNKHNYRESQAADRNKRVESNEAKGFRIGMVAAPSKIASSWRGVAVTVPDLDRVKAGAELIPTEDIGQADYDNNANRAPNSSDEFERFDGSVTTFSDKYRVLITDKGHRTFDFIPPSRRNS